MRILNVSISDMEFNNLGIKNENITFTEFTELLRYSLLWCIKANRFTQKGRYRC